MYGSGQVEQGTKCVGIERINTRHCTFAQFKCIAHFPLSILCICNLRGYPQVSRVKFIMWDQPATHTEYRWTVYSRAAEIDRAEDTTYFSRHCIRSRATWPSEGSTRSQLASHQHKKPHHDAVHIFDHELAQQWELPLVKQEIGSWSTLETSHLGCYYQRRHSIVRSCKNARRQQRSNQKGYPCARSHHAVEGDLTQKPRVLKLEAISCKQSESE